MLADTPLVKNLDNPAYMEVLLNGKANLEELFADMGIVPLTNAAESKADTDRLLPGFRALANIPSLPDKVVQLLLGPLKRGESN